MDGAAGSGGPSNEGASRGATPSSVDQVAEVVHRRSPMMFGVVAVCFFFPFISFACSGQRLLTFSGLQLVTGTEVSSAEVQENLVGEDASQYLGTEDETEEVGSEGLAVVALLAALLGVGVGFATGRPRSVWSAIAGVLGGLSLLALKFKLDGDIEEEGEGIVTLDYRFGFWLAFGLFALLATVHVRWLRAKPPPTGSVRP